MIEEKDGKTFYVDDETGARKEVKLERFDLLPVGPLTELARHYGRGALKYADRNWELGYPWGHSYSALNRHLTQWWDGEDVDPETGSSHLTAVAWHAFALLEFVAKHPEFDNRPNSPALPEKVEKEDESNSVKLSYSDLREIQNEPGLNRMDRQVSTIEPDDERFPDREFVAMARELVEDDCS